MITEMIQEDDRERGSKYKMRLFTSETKGELIWVPNPNNSQGERERKRNMNEQNGKKLAAT
jgi:hypothetical protein